MDSDNSIIVDKILETLQNDPVLSSCIKKFSKGDASSSKKIYPFLCIGDVSVNIVPGTMGRNGYDIGTFNVEVVGGTFSHNPEVAYIGNGEGKKGILQLCDDITGAIGYKNPDGLFMEPVKITDVNTGYRTSTGGSHWIAKIAVAGKRKMPVQSAV